jgi:hypothetical protein
MSLTIGPGWNLGPGWTLGEPPPLVTAGLVLNLDAGNPASYPGSGTTWTDLSGNGNNGTLVNGVGYSEDNGGSLVFDGVNDYVDCGPVAEVGSSLTGLTVSAWVLLNTLATNQIIFENGTGNTTNTFYMAHQINPSRFTFLIRGPTNLDFVGTTTDVITKINTWCYVTGVWIPNERIKIYFNSENKTLISSGAAQTSLINGNTNLIIGSRAAVSLFFNGKVADATIYNRALTDQEIDQNFNATRGRYGI